MITLPISPHSGVGPLRLGAPKADIRLAARLVGLGEPETQPEGDYFVSQSVQVDYDSEGRARFIGASPDLDTFRATYDGIDISDTEAAALFVRIAAADGGSHTFDPEGYLFPRQILSLWAADAENDEVSRRARRPLRPIWGQVGIGTEEYRRMIERTRARDT